MGSGLILLLIVGAWLAVLVPVALRSHEATSALATVDKFHDAMRVLSRRGVAGRASSGARTGQGGHHEPASARPPSEHDDDDAAVPRRRLTPAARRLRILVALVVVAIVTLVGALVGSLWLLVPHLLADLLLVGFVCWLRSQAVAKEELEWRRAMGQPARASSSDSVRVTPSRAVAPTAAPTVVAPARVAGVPDRMPSRALLHGAAPRLLAVPAPPVEAPARVRGAQGEPWQPVPVPVPTYVSAPAAPRRVIDLTRPVAAASLTSAERSVGIDDHGPELDHILDRRAVGD